MNRGKDSAKDALERKGVNAGTRKSTNLEVQEASRVSRHRKRVASSNTKRVKVTVPLRDVPLVKAIAGVLRSDDVEAERIRQSLHPVLTIPKAKTGPELVAFLRASPLTETGLCIERSTSAGFEGGDAHAVNFEDHHR